jgi:hypothetical protein
MVWQRRSNGHDKNKCKGNKTKKMKLVSKKPKIGPSSFEKWHGTHQKTQSVFKNKITNNVPNKLKFSGIPIFLVYKHENCF